MNRPVSAEELVEHTGFLRCLARELVGDERAEDMVQDTLVAALEKPPRQRDSLRGWLAIVVRNRARTSMRAERRRDQREERTARLELQGPGDPALEQLEIQRVLSDLVVALPDAQRTVLYLRYYEGLTLAEIVERLDCTSIAMVQRHHACALEELRKHLDARSKSDRTAWISALLPLVGPARAGKIGAATSVKVGVGVVAISTVWLTWQMIHEASDEVVLTASNAIVSTGVDKEPLDTRGPQSAHQFPAREVAPGEKQVAVVQGAIRSRDGVPLSGATVRWVALRVEDVEANPVWRSLDWGWLDRRHRSATSDSEGRFGFAEPPDGGDPFGSVLLAFHPRHVAAGIDLPPDPASRTALELILEPAEPVLVRVLGSDGLAVPEAIVRHVACTEQPRDAGDFVGSRYRRFLMNSGTTDREGRVELSPFPGEQVIWAEDRTRRSMPWQGEHPRRVELELGATITIGGTLSLPTWSPDYTGERRIVVAGRIGEIWRPVIRLRGVQEGHWGPLSLPLEGIAQFRVRLEGSPLIPEVVEFSAPNAGSHRNIDFVAEMGADLWFQTIDESGQPIPTARIECWWADPGVPGGTNTVEFGASPDGELSVWSFPEGVVHYCISAPGFASYQNSVGVPTTDGLVITLQRAGRIAGRCLSDGTPVPDFQIIFRREGIAPDNRSHSFVGREDGSFELDGLVPGDWYLSAATSRLPGGIPVLVTVSANEESLVEIELPQAIRGMGQVIDASTHEAVPEAVVQVYSGGLERSLPWDKPFRVSEDGSFDCDVFVPGLNYITVSAPGYAASSVNKKASPNDVLDWGEVALFRPQALEVSLLGFESLDIPPSDFRALSRNPVPLAEKSFDEKGQVLFESVPPGSCQLLILEPNQDWIRLQLELVPGAEWKYECNVTGDRRLDIRIRTPDDEPLNYSPAVLVTATEETGLFVVRSRIAREGRASFQGLRTSQCEVHVANNNGELVATQTVHFGSERHQGVEVFLGGEPLRVRVVDRNGDAIAGAWVRTRSPSGIDVLSIDDTDSDGWANQFVKDVGTLLLDVQHGVAGKRYGVPIDASVREMEFVLEASGGLELRLRDGDEQLASMATRIETPNGIALSDTRLSDAEGRVVHEPLGEGTYRIGVQRADCWPTSFEKHLSVGERGRLDVQVRRLGDLELTVVDANAVPISGLPIDLHSVEFGASVQAWIDETRVQSNGGLTTSTRGTITIDGLPNGSYAWSAVLGDQHGAGTFEVRANDTNHIQIGIR